MIDAIGKHGMAEVGELARSENDQDLIETLDRFFSLIDSGGLFTSTDGRLFRKLREDVSDALYQLLVWRRPFLEATRGLLWPYETLKKRVSFFENKTDNEIPLSIRKEAGLFLALLPFPGQWRCRYQTPRGTGCLRFRYPFPER